MRLFLLCCRVLVLLCGAAVLGCTPAESPPSGGSLAIREEFDIVYGTGGKEELTLDLYAPRDLPGPLPAVVILHGGGWMLGSKEEFEGAAQSLAACGYVAVTVSYRLVPHYRFPAQIEDAKCAVRWLRANADRYGVDPDRIAALGVSAGAFLALLVGLTGPADGFEGQGGHPEQSSRVQAVVNCMAPTDLTRPGPAHSEKLYAELLGVTRKEKPDAYRAASPLTYVRKGAPPVLTVHGTADEYVPEEQATRLDEALRAVGSTSWLEKFPGKDHGWTWTQEDTAHSMGVILAFLNYHLSPLAQVPPGSSSPFAGGKK
jgi:acetyl esterase/lipase